MKHVPPAFKSGDLVMCAFTGEGDGITTTTSEITKGKTYVIESVNPPCVRVLSDSGVIGGFFAARFVLAPPVDIRAFITAYEAGLRNENISGLSDAEFSCWNQGNEEFWQRRELLQFLTHLEET